MPSFPMPGRVHALAASALLFVYLAVMNGHLSSMDGFLMQHQAQTFVFDRQVAFRTPGRFWHGGEAWNSKFGIGLSLLYVPGMAVASPLISLVPASPDRPRKPATFYLQQLYENPLYAFGASWVHAVVTASTAWLVAGLVLALGGSLRASMWAMALFGIGSPALVYARGDFAQPLTGLCWTAALLAAMRFREVGSPSAAAACAAAVGYAILTRPFEGMLLLPAAALLVAPDRIAKWSVRSLAPALAVVAAAAAAVAVTAAVNWARSGSPIEFGYKLDGVWTVPNLARLAHLVVGPARGILWEFPALVLVPAAALALARSGRRRETGVLLLLCGALLLHTSTWLAWWGGWCWGLRLFLPAFPLLAAVAAAGIDRLDVRTGRWLPHALLLAGFLWALPCVVTDMLGGYAQATDASPMAWTLDAYPPYGAWQYLRRAFALTPLDPSGVDILWFRLALRTGYWSLVVPVALLAVAAALLAQARRALVAAERDATAPPAA